MDDSTEIFAPTSIRAKSSYTYEPSTQTGKVTVTAKTGTRDFYNVSFVNEKVFDSFSVNDVYGNQIGVADTSVLDEVLADDELAIMDVKVAKGAASWVPAYTTTDGVKRIMGTSSSWNVDGTRNPQLAFRAVNDDDPVGEAAHPYDRVDGDAGDYNRESMLMVVGSGRAHWAMNNGEGYTDLLIRTKANPSGAFVRVHVEAVSQYDDAIMTEIQVDDSESKWGLTADDTTVNIVVDKTHDFDKGNTQVQPGEHTCSINVTTNLPAKVSVPAQKDVNVETTGGNRHKLSNINTKSGSFTLRVTAEDGKHYRDYTINLSASKVNTTALNKLELRDGNGNIVATAVPESAASHTLTLQIDYKYHNSADSIYLSEALKGLKLYAYPDAGAVVKAGPGPLTITKPDGSVWMNNGHIGPVIENDVTTVGSVWKPHFTSNENMFDPDPITGASPPPEHKDTSFAAFDDTLYLTVANADGTDTVYSVDFDVKAPSEDTEIKSVTANRAFDNDYIYSVATTLNQNKAAYIGAADTDGNALPVTIESGAIRVDVPYDWKDTDVVYFTDIKTNGKAIYNIKRSEQWGNEWVYNNGSYVISNVEQDNQAFIMTGDDIGAYSYYNRGFSKLTTSLSNVKSENILYVISEKDYYDTSYAGGYIWNIGQSELQKIVKEKGAAYKIYIRRTTKDTGKVLNSIGSDD
ncbi:hypothetical protein, partial [Acutalibacter sp. 1XD8-36]|uniref:hypothetical protein n=1 Tax=Acutalibacter sp. 1XD8-36 TaxID=2320852 RepID=UPI001A9B41D5